MHLSRIAGIAALSAALSACSNSTQSLPATGLAGNTAAPVPVAMDAWHRALALNKLPSAGCFTATYPSAVWARVACGAPPNVLLPPRSRRFGAGQVVGNGNDYTADTTPHVISSAIGAFPNVQGLKFVIGGGARNAYSLQLNSNFFSTKACGSIPNCVGWSQFAYVNGRGTKDGRLFMQDWLLNFQSSFPACPPNEGWQYYGDACVRNSQYAVKVPNVDVTELSSMILTGDADSKGDSIYFSVGKKAYGMKNVQGDGITDLSQNWQGAEFNIIGNGGADEARFNSGVTITVSLQVNDGVNAAPTCPSGSGTTGETNNLNFVPAPAKPDKYKYPSIEFTMSSKAAGTPTCDTSKGSG